MGGLSFFSLGEALRLLTIKTGDQFFLVERTDPLRTSLFSSSEVSMIYSVTVTLAFMYGCGVQW